ncbi:sulfotransferase [Nocardioides sp. SYSU DS0663]|uniref:sulfotransferase n=1 Tax=Nocardioides sp. SYSU DS0663 TaxID=3416445 RepID=UPI003F4B0BBE
MTRQARTTVVLIAGGGRSGSTLLGNALGSVPGAVSAGEIKLGLRRGLVEDGHCGCREPVRSCPVWLPAFEMVFGSVPTTAEADELDRRIARLVRTRRVPWWLAGRPSAEADELADVLGRLITAVAEVSGASVVVDSSKLPAYGALLERSPLLDVRIVHLVRDPRAVAWSWQRQAASHQVGGYEEEMERFSPVKSGLMWLESSSSVPALWRDDPDNPLVVRYEDLVADPARELGRAAAHAGLEADLSFVRGDGLHLAASHAVAGNPNRVRLGPVQLRRDDEWQTAMPRRDQAVVSAITAPRRHRYGY